MKFAESDKVITKSIDTVTADVVKYMLKNSLILCTAESCTGGMIMELVTRVPGASGMFCGGICSYSEEIKMKLLGVRKETLERYTVYSAETASEMSAGALERFGCDVAAAVTGVAGPGDDKGVRAGTVYVSVRDRQREISKTLRLYEEYEKLDRDMIRSLTALRTLEAVLELSETRKER